MAVVIETPADGAEYAVGVPVSFEAWGTAGTEQVQIVWELDTNNPPDPQSPDYVTFVSAPVAAGERVSTMAVIPRSGIWYFRARAIPYLGGE